MPDTFGRGARGRAQEVIAFDPRTDSALLKDLDTFRNYSDIVGNKLVALGANGSINYQT